jgi:Fe-coproporphyrin III synthase
MISISRLLCGGESFGDSLRYQPGSRGQRDGATKDHGPVVVWNCTRSCNLQCLHCYSASEPRVYPNELTTGEARKLIDDLVAFRVPVLLISGGEPLIRPDIMDLAEYAGSRGMRVTFSTNGTLLTSELVRRMKTIGVGYVGISFDGIGATHDYFRARDGAFDGALRGVRHCLEEGQKVGLRFTINRHNHKEIGRIFDLIESEGIPRACFYHLVYSGRGAEMRADDLTHEESRAAMNLIMERTEAFYASGQPREILTVDNHADGVYAYLRLLGKDPGKARLALDLLEANGGNRTGIAIGCVDNEGNVHPDQFTLTHTLGNVRERSFGEIWSDTSNPIMAGLKNRKPLLKGRCSYCRWLDVCNGNFRARAEATTGDFWADDPACYLTDEEIALPVVATQASG